MNVKSLKTSILHKENIFSTLTYDAISGIFINYKLNPITLNQICINNKDHISIYELILDNENENKIILLNDYYVFGEINMIEKFISLNKKYNNYCNSIILCLDNKKLSFIQYNFECEDFETLALYALSPINMDGKMFSNDNLKIYTNLKQKYIIYSYNDNKINILYINSDNLNNKLNIINNNNNNNNDINNYKEEYYDTLGGDKYFNPSILIDLNENNVYKIIKIYIYKKYEDINGLDINENSMSIDNNYIFYLLYLPIDNKNKINNINLAIIENKKFNILKENLNETIFDFFVLENQTDFNINSIAILFGAYFIEIVNILNKTSQKIILNENYNLNKNININSNINNNIDQDNLDYIKKNIDLRGMGYLILNKFNFIFSTSTGELIFFSFNNNYINFNLISSAIQENEKNFSELGSPYNHILMLNDYLFFLTSYYSDSLILNYNNYKFNILYRINNYSPIINFHLINDNGINMILFTNGYNKNGKINYLYDKFVYNGYDIININLDLSYIKGIRFNGNLYSKYLISGTKDGKIVIFDNQKNEFKNITDITMINQESSLITCGLINVNDLDTIQFIIIVCSSNIQIFDPYLKSPILIRANEIFNEEEKINKCKFGPNCIIISNQGNKKIILISFHRYMGNILNSKNLYVEKKINQNICYRMKDLSDLINANNIYKFCINSKYFYNNLTYLIVYRSNKCLDIYNTLNLLYTDIKDKNNIKPILSNNYIDEIPYIISNNNIKDYYRISSDPSYIINFNIQENNINKTLTPKSLYFDMLNTKGILIILYKEYILVIYQLFYHNINNNLDNNNNNYNANNNIEIKFKKIYIEYLFNIDYKEFFMLSSNNLFFSFNNINGVSGVFFNLKNYEKFIYEKNGKICILPITTNQKIKLNNSYLTEYSTESLENGFLILENSNLKFCFTPKNFIFSENNMLIKSVNLNRFPVIVNYKPKYMPNNISYSYEYFIIEKELVNNNFIYYLTKRNENELEYEIQFAPNEIITQSEIVEIRNIPGSTSLKQFLAVGVNIIDEKYGENYLFKSKIQLYDMDSENLTKIFESNENNNIEGTISIIQNFNDQKSGQMLLVGEGNKVILYEYNSEELISKYKIECKNLITCSKIQSKTLIIGDLLESFSWILLSTTQNKSLNDNSKYPCSVIDFWKDEKKLGCILFDFRRNGHIFLVEKDINEYEETADFYIGKVITNLKICNNILVGNFNKNYYYYGADDGTIGYFTPINEENFEILSTLCEFFYNQLPYKSGLNPKSFFVVKNFPITKEKGRFIDFKVLNYFLFMPFSFQKIIAENVNTNRDKLIKIICDLLI